MLGKGIGRGAQLTAAKPQAKSASRSRRDQTDGDEDEGRSNIGRGHKSSLSQQLREETTNNNAETTAVSIDNGLGNPRETPRNKKRGSSYLDEILAQRGSKKKKKP